MLSLIEKIQCVEEIYLDKNNEKKRKYKFYFVLTNGMAVRFDPYYSNFTDESRNYNTFGDIYKFLVDEVVVNDKTKDKKDSKK